MCRWRRPTSGPVKPALERIAGSMSPWQQLSAELDQWQASGRVATLWWRDDDAAAVTPALERLLVLQRDRGVPLALAAIPARTREALARRLERNPQLRYSNTGTHTRIMPAKENVPSNWEESAAASASSRSWKKDGAAWPGCFPGVCCR